MYITDGKFSSSYTILLRRPEKSKQDRTSAWHTETFWCMTTPPGAAPMIRPTWSPTRSGMRHQPSAQARTPRVAPVSAESGTPWRPARGAAPREGGTKYVVRARGRGLAEADVAQAHVDEGQEQPVQAGVGGEPRLGFGHRHVEHVGHRPPVVQDLQRLPVVAPAPARLAGDVDVGKEVHADGP